jgi:hypothetical protein
MSDSRPSEVIRRAASSGGDVAEQVIDDEGRPQDSFDDGPHMGPESVGVLPVIHKGSDESQTVDRASAAALTTVVVFDVPDMRSSLCSTRRVFHLSPLAWPGGPSPAAPRPGHQLYTQNG